MRLSPAQVSILRELWLREQARDVSPSVVELATAAGLRSSGTTHKHITVLLARGMVERPPMAARALRGVWTALGPEDWRDLGVTAPDRCEMCGALRAMETPL